MLPESTTTMGLLELVAIDKDFHSMKAVAKTRPKFKTWARDCRALEMLPARADSIVAGVLM